MNQEFTRKPGDTAISALGFEVSVSGGMEVTVEYREANKLVRIPAERTTTGGIGLFMDWATFPDGAGADEQRLIFERVIYALWFLKIPIGEIEITPGVIRWPLPRRPTP